MEAGSLWLTEFRLSKTKPGRCRQSRHQGQSTGRPGKAQLASFKEYNQREGLGSHQSVRDTGSIKCSGDGKGKLHPVLLGRQDVG